MVRSETDPARRYVTRFDPGSAHVRVPPKPPGEKPLGWGSTDPCSSGKAWSPNGSLGPAAHGVTTGRASRERACALCGVASPAALCRRGFRIGRKSVDQRVLPHAREIRDLFCRAPKRAPHRRPSRLSASNGSESSGCGSAPPAVSCAGPRGSHWFATKGFPPAPRSIWPPLRRGRTRPDANRRGDHDHRFVTRSTLRRWRSGRSIQPSIIRCLDDH